MSQIIESNQFFVSDITKVAQNRKKRSYEDVNCLSFSALSSDNLPDIYQERYLQIPIKVTQNGKKT